jgi:hypothetical protein
VETNRVEYRVENPGYNDTKSAFADYAAGVVRRAGNRAAA